MCIWFMCQMGHLHFLVLLKQKISVAKFQRPTPHTVSQYQCSQAIIDMLEPDRVQSQIAAIYYLH